MNKLEKFLNSKFLVTLFSILLGFVVGALFLMPMGISPIEAYAKLFDGVFGSVRNMAYSVVYATPLIFTGLAVAFSFRTGVFNIGAEGQFVMGSMAACVVGILVPAPSIILVPLCFLAALAVGALWGLIVAFLKVKWGINEVLSMIMFNWIAFYLSNYIADLPMIHNEGNAEATKNVQDAARILFPQAWLDALCPASNWGILLAVLAVILIYVLIEKTTLGYQLKAVGFNRSAAEYGGISVNKSIYIAMAISGALAGMGGAIQLLGMPWKPYQHLYCTGELRLPGHQCCADRCFQPHRRILCRSVLRRAEVWWLQAEPDRCSVRSDQHHHGYGCILHRHLPCVPLCEKTQEQEGGGISNGFDHQQPWHHYLRHPAVHPSAAVRGHGFLLL